MACPSAVPFARACASSSLGFDAVRFDFDASADADVAAYGDAADFSAVRTARLGGATESNIGGLLDGVLALVPHGGLAVVLDIDDTMLRQGSSDVLSPQWAPAVARLLAAGARVVALTARDETQRAATLAALAAAGIAIPPGNLIITSMASKHDTLRRTIVSHALTLFFDDNINNIATALAAWQDARDGRPASEPETPQLLAFLVNPRDVAKDDLLTALLVASMRD